VTLARAQLIAGRLGITRVSDITRLDRVGVPVFAGIRPSAVRGSLCVSAGKGLRPIEAQVGAYMEAIEFAFAEFNRGGLDVFPLAAREVYEGTARPDSLLDFCPVLRTKVDLDALVACVEAIDVRTGRAHPVPAELVFHPMPPELPNTPLFGTSTNGLSSGNTILEATIHGLCEVIERDVLSFGLADDRSRLVRDDTLPSELNHVRRAVSAAGLELYVRTSDNEFGLPYFSAAVAEPGSRDPIYVSGGTGCHPSRRIALVRAVCEALQSRLSFIHGGRDDLTDRHAAFRGWQEVDRASYASALLDTVRRAKGAVSFRDVADRERQITGLAPTLHLMLDVLADRGFEHVLRVVYTSKADPVQVVRVIVPRLEFFTHATRRVGPRLRALFEGLTTP
jgi:ribosomal protein S12 methylthiotransferase accessory factor